jgi:hypothetical protein
MLWCWRLIGVGTGCVDGIDRNYGRGEQAAGAGDVVGTFAFAIGFADPQRMKRW